MKPFGRSVAVVVGIDAYANGLPRLQTAVADAKAIAELLEKEQGYQVELLLDAQATRAGLVELFEACLPEMVGEDDRLLIYFAGHGTAQDGDDGPDGFLVPQDAASGTSASESLLPMTWLHHAVRALPCRHRLLMLDCCFAGTFRWSSFRSFLPKPQPIYRARYQRFVEEPAAQVLTSAAADQKALDIIDGLTLGRRARPVAGGHSPFASAVLAGLAGAADMPGPDGYPDGVITASELYLYVRDVVERASEAQRTLQTPGLWPLPEHGRGEYLFWVPGRTPRLMEDPRLDAQANPWRGLHAYDARHAGLFFGRDAEITELEGRLAGSQPFIAVLGASGTGKSSLVKGGLLPRLETSDPPWHVVGPIRPGSTPGSALAGALEALEADTPRQLLVIDQLEELFTLACPPDERAAFFDQVCALSDRPGLRVIVTLRSDFEAQFQETAIGPILHTGRYVIPPMTRDGLREIIRGPAELRVLYFEPADLPDTLVDEVVALPGGLPLLSFTLAEMYRAYLRRDGQDRALTGADYERMGGVTGSLRTRATKLFEDADPDEQETIRRLMLRLVANEGGGLVRRRALASELTFDDPAEQGRIEAVVERFVEARLLVLGTIEGVEAPFIEPAHDALVTGWDRIYRWFHEAEAWLPLQRAVWRAARTWTDADEKVGLLWNGDPRLPQAVALRDRLNALEDRFVARSDRRRSTRRWTLAGIVSAVVLILAASTVYALSEADRADRSARSASSSAQAERQAAAGARLERDKAEKARVEANEQRNRADVERDRAREQSVRAQDAVRLSVAQQLRDTDPTAAALVLAEAQRPERSTATLQMLLSLAAQPGLLKAALEGHTSPVHSAAFSPDGKRVVTASADNTARVWNADGTGTPILLQGHTRPVRSAAFSPDGKRVVTASLDNTARVWSSDGKGTPILLRGHAHEVYSALFSPDGKRVVTASHDNTARVWNADGNGTPIVLQGHTGGVNSAAFSPDGKRVVTASEDNTARVWNANGNGTPILLQGHTKRVFSAAFSPDGKRVVTASFDNTARVWNAEGNGTPILLEGHTGDVTSAAFSPDSKRVVTGSEDNTARVWNADGNGTPILLQGHTGLVLSAAFSPDGKRVVTASFDNTARVWNAAGNGTPILLQGHGRFVLSAVFSADGKRVVTASFDHTARVWNVGDTGTPILLHGHTGLVFSAAFSPDGKRVVTASEDNTARVWNTAGNGSPILLQGHTGPVLSAAFSPDGKRVVTASLDNTARIWNTDGTGTAILLQGHTGLVLSATSSPDGKRVVTASWDNSARVWNTDGTGTAILLQGHTGRLNSAAFSPDGKRVVTASQDRTARVWNVDGTGTPILLQGHTGGVNSAAFSPDGKRVVTAAEDKTARVWNADGNVAPILLEGHTMRVFSAAFSPDGKRVVSASQDRTARVWNANGKGAPVLLEGHADLVRSAAFSPDGKRVVTASGDNTARVWNADGDGAPILLEGYTGEVISAVFSFDGKRVVTASADNTARVWDIHGPTLQTLLAERIRWCLPLDQRISRFGQTAEEANPATRGCRARKGLAQPGE